VISKTIQFLEKIKASLSCPVQTVRVT
jgi:hypothetical protein